jgi:hypothetical protein
VAFKRHFQKSGGFFKLIWGFYKDNEAFWRNFKKISIIFEDFFRKVEAFSRIARLIKYIFSGIEAFSAVSLWPL